MPGDLDIAVAQPRCVSHDVAANAAAHAAVVRSARARVVVFPELSLTGYEMGAEAIAPADPRLAPLIGACAETGTLALAGAPVRGERGASHIAMLAVDHNRATVAYRKLYLAKNETESFTPGTEPSMIQVDGWRLGLAICKDTGIPEHASRTASLGIDAYLAGVLHTPDEAPTVQERAQRVATSHRVWVAVASFAGFTGEGYAPAAGGSGIWAADATTIAKTGPEPGAIVRAALS